MVIVLDTVESSTKLPVTYLNIAPQVGAYSNLHR